MQDHRTAGGRAWPSLAGKEGLGSRRKGSGRVLLPSRGVNISPADRQHFHGAVSRLNTLQIRGSSVAQCRPGRKTRYPVERDDRRDGRRIRGVKVEPF